MKMTINFKSLIDISVQTNATKSRYVVAKTMTKLLNLGEVSVQTNIAKLCYVGAKMTINFKSLIDISVQSHTIQSCFIMAKTIAKLNDQTIVFAETNVP
jgi:hypothetical protein